LMEIESTFLKIVYYGHMYDTVLWFHNEMLCIQNIYFQECWLVIIHRSSFSYKLPVVTVFEWPSSLSPNNKCWKFAGPISIAG
jgi:hypothetical protein